MDRLELVNKARQIGVIVLGALILCFWAFYNHYPLYFNSDTAVYLEAAFYKFVGPDRPIMYGLWMYYVSFQETLWPVVFFQALIVAYVLYLYFKYFIQIKKYQRYYLGFIILITFCTGASFNVSWLLADIFTAVSILSVGLLLFVKELKALDKVTVSIVAVLGVVMHNTHFYICLGLILLIFAGYIFKVIRVKYLLAGIKPKNLFLILTLLLISYLFTASVHYACGGGFKGSRGGEIFLFGNMVEMGVVNTYLGETCDEKDYQLCLYKDTLPNNFLWAGNSPISKMGGWDGCKEEFTTITKDIITTPKYLKAFVFKSVIYTLKQLSHFDTGEAGIATPRIEMAFSNFYPYEFEQFDNSRQRKGELNFGLVNFAQTVLVGIALLFIIWALFEDKSSPKFKLFIIFLLLAILINAAICAVFSGVYFRYQARVVWLLLLPPFLYALNKFSIINKDPNQLN